MGRRQKQQEEEIEDLDGDEEIIDQAESDESEGAEETVAEEDTGAETEEGLESEFSEAIGDDGLDEYDDSDVDLKVVDEVLSHKDQNARALAIRRAIEERLESKRLSRDLDYLDLDLED